MTQNTLPGNARETTAFDSDLIVAVRQAIEGQITRNAAEHPSSAFSKTDETTAVFGSGRITAGAIDSLERALAGLPDVWTMRTVPCGRSINEQPMLGCIRVAHPALHSLPLLYGDEHASASWSNADTEPVLQKSQHGMRTADSSSHDIKRTFDAQHLHHFEQNSGPRHTASPPFVHVQKSGDADGVVHRQSASRSADASDHIGRLEAPHSQSQASAPSESPLQKAITGFLSSLEEQSGAGALNGQSGPTLSVAARALGQGNTAAAAAPISQVEPQAVDGSTDPNAPVTAANTQTVVQQPPLAETHGQTTDVLPTQDMQTVPSALSGSTAGTSDTGLPSDVTAVGTSKLPSATPASGQESQTGTAPGVDAPSPHGPTVPSGWVQLPKHGSEHAKPPSSGFVTSHGQDGKARKTDRAGGPGTSKELSHGRHSASNASGAGSGAVAPGHVAIIPTGTNPSPYSSQPLTAPTEHALHSKGEHASAPVGKVQTSSERVEQATSSETMSAPVHAISAQGGALNAGYGPAGTGTPPAVASVLLAGALAPASGVAHDYQTQISSNFAHVSPVNSGTPITLAPLPIDPPAHHHHGGTDGGPHWGNNLMPPHH